MNPRTIAAAIAAARVGLGATLFAAPGTAGVAWIGEPAEDPRTQSVLRGLGARDVAIGLGTLAALARGRSANRWIEAAIVADAADALASIAARRSFPPMTVAATVATAGAAAALGIHTRFARPADD